jgi:cation diffusion facilitator family transporter
MLDVQRQKSGVATLSVLSNSMLVFLKIVIGLAIGSVSVISEAIHSGVDLIAAVIAWFAVRTSGKPADDKHPFGHGKIENISGTIEALLIFIAAGWIIYEAVKKLINPRPLEEVNLGVVVMLISAVMNYIVSQLLFKVGKATESMALQADGWHLRTDVWTSLGVMAGLGLIWAGQLLFPSVNLAWIDPIAAIAVALLIVNAAYRLTLESGRDLLDESLTPEEEEFIRQTIIAHCPPVCGFHRLRTRKAGAQRFIEFHLLVSGEMSVADSHQLTDVLTHLIEQRFPASSVTIHIEPCNGFCSSVCIQGCLLSAEQRAAMQQRRREQDTQS